MKLFTKILSRIPGERVKTMKRMKVTIQTERLLTISHRSTSMAWCPTCGVQTRLLTVDQTAALTRTSALAVYRRADAREVHFIETDGALLICVNSLAEAISKE